MSFIIRMINRELGDLVIRERDASYGLKKLLRNVEDSKEKTKVKIGYIFTRMSDMSLS